MKHIGHFVTLFILLSLFSCKSHEIVTEIPVEVPSVHTEYVTKHDSVYFHDSIYQIIETKGDTVYNTKLSYKYKYKYLTDTILSVDTITKPVYITKTETKEVERKQNLWERLTQICGTIALVGLLIYTLIFALTTYLKNKGICL